MLGPRALLDGNLKLSVLLYVKIEPEALLSGYRFSSGNQTRTGIILVMSQTLVPIPAPYRVVLFNGGHEQVSVYRSVHVK